MTDTELVLLPEAAARLRTTPDAIRQRIKRGSLRGVKGNDGRLRVYVSKADQPTERDQTPTEPDRPNVQSDNRPNDRTPNQTELVAELRRQVERLEGELQRQDQLHREERQQLLAMLERATTPRPTALERLLSWLRKENGRDS